MFPLLVLGCTSTPTYSLTLTPVTGTSPDPFEGVDRYELVVDPGGPAEERLSLTVDGKMAEGVEVPPLADVRVAVEGFVGGALRLRGLSERLTAKGGSHEATIFVARAGSTTRLPALPEALYTPVLAALGDGRFWVAGGATNNRNNEPARSRDAVLDLHLAPPDDGLTFAEIGTLPTYEDEDEVSETVRVGATATLLTVEGSDVGKLLIVGGGSADPLSNAGQSTKAVSLYDPTTDTWEDLLQADALAGGRMYHVAIENALGNVVVAGGLGVSSGSRASLATDVELYDRADRAFSTAGRSETGVLDLFAADLGDDGTLLCGGGDIDGSNYNASSSCSRVPLDGSSVEEFQALPAALSGAAMVRLDDGTVLLTGGATTDGGTASNESIPARNDAWVYSPSTGRWGALSAKMNMARALHQMVRLADGRVLIVGGAESYNMDTAPGDGLSCLELYNPATSAFSAVDGCTSADDAGGLSGRIPRTSIASDPEFGVLIAGGLGVDGSAQSNVSLYVPGE